MSNQIREIITKAVIGKGHLKNQENYTVCLENSIDHVLGCWIVAHQYESYMKNSKLYVKGNFDINLWYALENEQQSKVHVQKIEYIENLPISTKEDVDFNNEIMLVCTCPMQPVCLEAKKIDKNNVDIIVEKTMHVDIVGETKISIEVCDKREIWDEIEESINTSFLEK